jgi:uncharacterized zinc-type alcohol dehydrogenase-like protein
MADAPPMPDAPAIDALCMACEDESCDFKPMRAQRRPLGPSDIEIDMKYCGVCHTDLHRAANHLAGVGRATVYPCVPGHELAGVCAAVGPAVRRFKVGDHIGVGCLVDSCLECEACSRGEEQMCKESVGTYQGKDRSGRAAHASPAGIPTLGGYTSRMVVHERFGVLIPKQYPLELAGPVMCAGITMYDPLKRYGAVGGGLRVGVVGLGGLGVMGLKLANALGNTTTAISRQPSKAALASSEAGAAHFLVSTDESAMASARGSLDLILNTIPAYHDYTLYQQLVAPGGRHVILGANAVFAGVMFASKLLGGSERSPVVSSGIGGLKNTQECIDLCAQAAIYPVVDVRPVQHLADIYRELDSCNDGGKRHVLDIAGTLHEGAFAACADVAPPPLTANATGFIYPSVVLEILRIVGREAWGAAFGTRRRPPVSAVDPLEQLKGARGAAGDGQPSMTRDLV